MTRSLRLPPPGLTLLQQLLWPVIFAQILALKLWVRAHYGRGVPYSFTISPWGRVFLLRMPVDLADCWAVPGGLRPTGVTVRLFAPSARLAAALAPQTCDVPAPEPSCRRPSVHVWTAAVSADTS